MPLVLCFFIFCAFAPMQAQIKKIPIYPSGITVSWAAVPPALEEEAPASKPNSEKEPVKKKKTKKAPKPKKLKKGELPAPLPEPPAPPAPPASIEPITAKRLVRVVSAMELEAGENLVLAFYDANRKPLQKQHLTVSNTVKPSPAHAFFMDKAVYRGFQGLLDTYFFPPKAAYINVAVLDKKGAVINVPSNPDYDDHNMVSLEEFTNLEPKKRMMLQFEVKGSAKTNIMRMAIFRFR